ncbi:MAG: D-alanyl-D-alanine carboxypeptidase [Ruminococcaceae bacterium]|nr:D-alanyl-D-alanine carboxypeptidase [Oscillospiraceae bacterium]
MQNNNNARYEQYRKEMNRKKAKKTARNRLIILQVVVFLLIFGAISALIFIPGNSSLADITGIYPSSLESEKIVPATAVIDNSPLVKEISSEVYSSNAILVYLSSGEVIAAKSPDEKIYPASLTKILTAIVVLEHFEDVNVMLEVPADIYAYLIQENASCAGFVANEKVKVIDLLYGVMLPSGADACLTLVRAVAGNEQAFAKKMTDKAHQIGAVNTNFTNSTGLHDDNHYTTVRDMSIILKYALENETFRTLFTTESYTTPATNKHKYGLTFSNTTFNAFKRGGLTNNYVKGGKTGFTGEARLCLATLGEKNGKEYILVTVGAGSGSSNKGVQHAQDANYIYQNYTLS